MKYKKNFWYILGIVLTFASVLIMSVTMVLMFFGSNIAIIWFFAACPVLVFGVLTSQAVKRRYEEAVACDREPVPMFWHIRYTVLLLREFIASRGLLRVIFTALTCLSVIATLVLGGFCGYYAHERASIKNDSKYIENQIKYEEYYTLWLKAHNEGDKDAAHRFFEIMEAYNSDNAEGRKQIKTYTESLKEFGVWTALSGAVAVFFGTVLTTYMIHKKRRAASHLLSL